MNIEIYISCKNGIWNTLNILTFTVKSFLSQMSNIRSKSVIHLLTLELICNTGDKFFQFVKQLACKIYMEWVIKIFKL